jgi:formamidopyrimidine-DNA glycosylase
MPELPEVEITRRGIAPHVEGRQVSGVVVRHAGLRWPVPADLAERIVGCTVTRVDRRAKYLLLDCGAGTLIVHLGMSGSLRVVDADAPPGPWDHVDIRFGRQALRLRDPRRFGAVLWHGGMPDAHPLIAHLGVEPLGEAFTAEALHAASRGRAVAIKLLLMNADVVVGIGNIYASESLFRARVNPRATARRLSLERCAAIVAAVRATLADALAAGGSSLRDFVHSDGTSGYFQQQYFVYGREGEPCRVCATPIRRFVQGQRSTFACPHCQRR